MIYTVDEVRGTATVDSDIDLLIDTTGAKKSATGYSGLLRFERSPGEVGGSGHCQFAGTETIVAWREEFP